MCAPRNGKLADVVEDIESEHLHRIKMFSAKTPAPEGLLQHNTYIPNITINMFKTCSKSYPCPGVQKYHLNGLQRHKREPDGSSQDAERVAKGRGRRKLDVPVCQMQAFRVTGNGILCFVQVMRHAVHGLPPDFFRWINGGAHIARLSNRSRAVPLHSEGMLGT